MRDLTRTIAAVQPGSTVKLAVLRDGKEITVSAKLGETGQNKQAKADTKQAQINLDHGSWLKPRP